LGVLTTVVRQVTDVVNKVIGCSNYGSAPSYWCCEWRNWVF